jgi:hypothetical protein
MSEKEVVPVAAGVSEKQLIGPVVLYCFDAVY